MDGEGKCAESEPLYQKALSAATATQALLNNVGNHYLLCDQPEKAALYFERLVKINPAHSNGNLQLARLAMDQKQSERAMAHLQKVSAAIEKEGEPASLFTLATVYARLGAFDRSEILLQKMLVQRPGDFDILFALGRAAARAKHYDRARNALEAAAKVQPQNVDVLFELGLVSAATKDYTRAVFLLAQAKQKSPRRSDILLALARAAEDAGFYGDSALAYDEYLVLQHDDAIARRDRARVLGYTGARLKEGLAEMAAYVASHPNDPTGHYNLAQFTWRNEPEKSLQQLRTALRLDPKFVPAHVSLAWLLQRQGDDKEAAAHLESALKIAPDNLRALDLLGVSYLSLDRPSDAEKAFRRALAINKTDPDVQLHLGRALMALNRESEARPLLERSQQARAARSRDPRREPGMIESATLNAEERTAREIERFRRMSQARPDDPELQLHLADLLLASGHKEDALSAFRQLLTLNAGSEIWEQAGRLLVTARQFDLGRQFLERALPQRPTARLDLVRALLQTTGPDAALQALGQMPDGEQAGDYLLMKARILDASGRQDEASSLLTAGLRGSGLRPDIVQQAALLLMRRNREKDALALLNDAISSDSSNSELLLCRALALALANDLRSSETQVRQIELRWPEWDRPYLLHALLREQAHNNTEALQKLKIAMALGANDTVAQCLAARLSHAPSRPECASGIRLFLNAK